MPRISRFALLAAVSALFAVACGSADDPTTQRQDAVQRRFDSLLSVIRAKMDVAGYVSANGVVATSPGGSEQFTLAEVTDGSRRVYAAHPEATFETTVSKLTVIEDQASLELAVTIHYEEGGTPMTLSASGVMNWKLENGAWNLTAITVNKLQQQ